MDFEFYGETQKQNGIIILFYLAFQFAYLNKSRRINKNSDSGLDSTSVQLGPDWPGPAAALR